MNVQRIFDMLQEDQNNTALGIICAELEKQGYKVRDEGFHDCITGGKD